MLKEAIIYTTSQNIPITNSFGITNSYNNTFDYNLYFTPGGAATTSTNFNKGLIRNHSYSWTVRACRNDGTMGAWSTALTFKESAKAR